VCFKNVFFMCVKNVCFFLMCVKRIFPFFYGIFVNLVGVVLLLFVIQKE
jgi:hypothetical protein